MAPCATAAARLRTYHRGATNGMPLVVCAATFVTVAAQGTPVAAGQTPADTMSPLLPAGSAPLALAKRLYSYGGMASGDESRNACGLNLRLAMPKTTEELQAVLAVRKDAVEQGVLAADSLVWLGGHWNDLNQAWEWDDHTDVDAQLWIQALTNAKKSAGQGDSRLWLAMGPDGSAQAADSTQTIGLMCQVVDATRVVNGLGAKEELDHVSQIDQSVSQVEQMEERSEFRAAASAALDAPLLQDPAGARPTQPPAPTSAAPAPPAPTTTLAPLTPTYTFVGFGTSIDARSHCGSTRRPAMPRTPEQLAALLDAVHTQVEGGAMANDGPYSVVWLGGQWKQREGNAVWEWDDETPVSQDMEWQAEQPSSQQDQSKESYLAMDSHGMLLDAAMDTSYAVFCEGVPDGEGNGSAVLIHGRPYQVVMEKDDLPHRAGSSGLLSGTGGGLRLLAVQGGAAAFAAFLAAAAVVALLRLAAPRAASYGHLDGAASEPVLSIV